MRYEGGRLPELPRQSTWDILLLPAPHYILSGAPRKPNFEGEGGHRSDGLRRINGGRAGRLRFNCEYDLMIIYFKLFIIMDILYILY